MFLKKIFMHECTHGQGKGATVEEWFALLAEVRSVGKDCILGYGSSQVWRTAISQERRTPEEA